MNNIEKINKINKSLIEVRERYELEIDELVQFELRKMVDIFNNDNKNFCELYIIAGMGGCSFYISFEDKRLKTFNEAYNFKEFKDFKNQLSNFKDNISEYLEEQYEDKNIDKNNMFIISKEFKTSYKEVIETIEGLEKGFFKLDYITEFDSRIPPIYKTLENNINLTIKDDNFLKLIASQHYANNWTHFASNRIFYKSLNDFYSNKEFNKNRNIEEKGNHKDLFLKEKDSYNEFKYKTNIELAKKLILESNIFNNLSNDLNITKVEDMKNFDIVSIELNGVKLNEKSNNYVINLKKELNNDYELGQIYKSLFALLQFGKPSEFNKIEKDKKDYLAINSLYYSKFDNKLFEKLETLDLKEIVNELEKEKIFNFRIENKITKENYEKTFNGYQEILEYALNEKKDLEIDIY